MARTQRVETLAALAVAASLLLAPRAAPAADATLEVTTLFESDTAWRLRTPRRIQKSQNRVEVVARLRLSPSLGVRGLGRVLWDPVGRLVGPDPDLGQEPLDRWQVGDSSRVEAELRELHLDWTGRFGPARLDLRLGKQQVVWGQSFGLRVLDRVNAQDFREFILDDFADARTPTWGLRLDALVRRISLQALVFPDFEPDVLPDPESEFALEPILRGLLPTAAPSASGPPLLVLDDPEEPGDWRIQSWGYGLRVATLIGGVDVALHYWDRIDPRGVFRRRILPLAHGSPLNVLERDHVRVRTLGFSFSTTFGDFALWGEGGLSAGRAYVVDDLGDRDGVVRRADLEYAIGLDWNGWQHLFANVQFIQFVIFDHDRRIELDAYRQFLSLLLRFELRGETIFPQLFVLYGTNEDDVMIRPSIEWRATDHLSLTVGADVFTGPRQGLLGQYARRRDCVPAAAGGCLFDPPPGRPSRVFVRLRYEFAWRR